MPPLKYHPGQVAVQDEANTRPLADHLAHWVGLFASPGADGALHFAVLSGPAPLVAVAGPNALRFAFPDDGPRPTPGRVGGLAMNLGLARRARINGELADACGVLELHA